MHVRDNHNQSLYQQLVGTTTSTFWDKNVVFSISQQESYLKQVMSLKSPFILKAYILTLSLMFDVGSNSLLTCKTQHVKYLIKMGYEL